MGLTFSLKLDNLFIEAQATNPDYSAEFDTRPFIGNIYLNVATNATNTDTPAITVEHSATGGGAGFAAVPASALFNVESGAADTFTDLVASTASDEWLGLNRQQLKRYVRVVMTGAVASARTISITAGAMPQYTEA